MVFTLVLSFLCVSLHDHAQMQFRMKIQDAGETYLKHQRQKDHSFGALQWTMKINEFLAIDEFINIYASVN